MQKGRFRILFGDLFQNSLWDNLIQNVEVIFWPLLKQKIIIPLMVDKQQYNGRF